MIVSILDLAGPDEINLTLHPALPNVLRMLQAVPILDLLEELGILGEFRFKFRLGCTVEFPCDKTAKAVAESGADRQLLVVMYPARL